MPIDLGSVSALITSLSTAADMTKAMLGIRDAALIQSKVIELQGTILSAQSAALAANTEYFAQLELIQRLEKEIADLEAWDEERQEYRLADVAPGVYAYVPQPGTSAASVPHWLCSNCFEHRKKSLL